ncbi:MAG: chromate transporter [Acetobacteraceae bacterium]
MIATLLQLFALFALLSMVAFGGGANVIPDIQRAAVQTYQWMTAKEFLDLFAISRTGPGPGSMIAAMVGLRAAGLAGALVAFVAMFGPSSVVVHCVARFWNRAARRPWRAVVERALAPVGIGMTFATGLALVRGNEHEILFYAITAVSTVVFAFTEIHPLLLLASGAAILLLAGG